MEKIGTIFVDAGIVMIGDPCYTLPDSASHRDDTTKDWDKFCDKLHDNPNGVSFPFSTKETGIVVESGYGDGEYPVFVERDRHGRIAALMVRFFDDSEEEE